MNTVNSLIKRNVKLFFKDKGMFLVSLITPVILLVLYVTFLKNVYKESFMAGLPEWISEKLVDSLVGGQLISSILSVSAVTVAFCSNMLMVQDKANGEGNVLVFESDILVTKGTMNYKTDGTEIKNGVLTSNALYFVWTDLVSTDVHGKLYNEIASTNRFGATNFNMIETDTTVATGGDGFRHAKSTDDLDFTLGTWHNVCFEYYVDEAKYIFYLDGVKVVEWSLTISEEAFDNIQTIAVATMDRFRDCEVLFDNVFCGKITK